MNNFSFHFLMANEANKYLFIYLVIFTLAEVFL